MGVGSEAQALRILGVIQRLDAEPVAREKQRLRFAIPDGEGECAVQMLGAGIAPLGIGFEDDFGIAVGKKAVATRLQLDAQLRVVVDSAVEHQHQV